MVTTTTRDDSSSNKEAATAADSLFSEIKDLLVPSDGGGDTADSTAAVCPRRSSPPRLRKEIPDSRVDAAGSPEALMARLSRLLFAPPSASDDASSSRGLSNRDALEVLQFFVSRDANKYLKPASKAVRDEAVALASSSSSSSDRPPVMVVIPELLKLLVSQLANSVDVQVSQHAADAVVAGCRKLGPSPFGEDALKEIAATWRSAWNGTGVIGKGDTVSAKKEASTVAVRCASAVVRIVCLDDSMMRAAKKYGDINLILTMFADESDPLLEMAALDLIEQLATTQPMHRERARWLLSNDIVVPLLQMSGGTEQGYPDPILGGSALRVVAALCKLGHQDSELFGGSGGAELLSGFHRALHNFEVSGELDRLAIVDAVSSFASASCEALDLVVSDPKTREMWLSLNVAQPKLKAAILGSVSMVLDPPDVSDVNGESIPVSAPSNKMGLKLYSSLGQTNNSDPTELLLSLAKTPLDETRLAAYSLLVAVAKLPTGGQVLMTHPGLFDFLVERESEKTKEGREGKYAIVKAIMDSEVKGLLAEEIVRKLERYLKEGPHYVKAMTWELATES